MDDSQSFSNASSILLDNILFEKIATDLLNKGFSLNQAALPIKLTEEILDELKSFSDYDYGAAGIGRNKDLTLNPFVRTDSIRWIEGQTSACQNWNIWAQDLKSYLNFRLFLGLSTFESHFSHYSPGDFYKRHYDAFKSGRSDRNRILSIVVYFNSIWGEDDGGELVLYETDNDDQGVKTLPLLGSIVVFLSEDFPHEVLPSKRDRYSIAGWFRSNSAGSLFIS